ncbi:MAG: DUF4397 domain-containing protein [Chloroflexi bacterium]|nr:DUF4397 domain-containing protein [Chloroflexota bacterium]
MSKIVLLCALLLVFTAPVPLAAQTNLTIPERLAADGQNRFTTLIAALQATGLDVLLSSDKPMTLLAPTDTAFQTLADFLGETRAELLADAPTLTRILRYHIVPGRVFFRQWVQGQPIATSLDGATVQGRLTNGLLTLGDAQSSAQASPVDLIASNGVIQVLSGVLLPVDVLPTAHLRVADFSPDTPGLDVYLDGKLTLFQAFGFPMVTGWIELPAAIHTIAFTTNGGSLDNALIIPSDFTLRPNSWTTLAAVGSVNNQTLFPVLIHEDAAPIPAGKVRITVLNAVEGAPPLDFSLNTAVVVSRLGFPFALGDNDGYFSFDQTAGTYTVSVKNYGETEPLAAALAATPFAAGTHALVAIVGSIAQPRLIVSADQR